MEVYEDRCFVSIENHLKQRRILMYR